MARRKDNSYSLVTAGDAIDAGSNSQTEPLLPGGHSDTHGNGGGSAGGNVDITDCGGSAGSLSPPDSAPDSLRGADGRPLKPLTLLPLVVLIFFEVSGGPFGTEDAVIAGGPLLCVLGFMIFPIVWSLPEALVTAELATAFPENSGYVAWVTAAFGPFWGFLEGWLSWISGVTDNSLYPVMLGANLEFFFPQLGSGWPRLTFLVGMSLFLSYLNYRGLSVVGHTIIISCVAIIMPFVVIVLLAIPHMQPENWTKVDWPSVNWFTYLNIMFWNLNYWDSVSTLAGEVHNPQKTFPRALMMAVMLVALCYLLPILAALSVTTDTSEWSLGFFGRVADMIGGRWLAVWVMVAAACSQVGQYQAEMASDSYMLQGMAERGFLPLCMGRRSRHDTPTVGIILSSLGVLSLASLNFVEIVEMLNAVYCLAELLEFAAFVWLRIKAPHLHRPYRIPLPTWACVLMLLPASALLVVMLALPVVFGQVHTIVMTVSSLLAGCLIWPLLQTAKRRGWLHFAPLHFDIPTVLDTENVEEYQYCSVARSPFATADASVAGSVTSHIRRPSQDRSVSGTLFGDASLKHGLPPSLEHQNMRVEAVVPGHHRHLLEERARSFDGRGSDCDSLDNVLGGSPPQSGEIERRPRVEPRVESVPEGVEDGCGPDQA
mmetsp:Transcript_4121/g.11811  ORF Transcript_4121/g.11811 Transcript_4121/m.11811 type:complete len:657 (-) Transcript_4121:1518-3488(-)